MRVEDVQEIQGVILALHRCESRHIASTPVRETFQGQTAWEGNVETFELINHPKAKRAYGLIFEDDGGKKRYLAGLEIPPVDSAESAVKIALASRARK
jgi:hypothetical protein